MDNCNVGTMTARDVVYDKLKIISENLNTCTSRLDDIVNNLIGKEPRSAPVRSDACDSQKIADNFFSSLGVQLDTILEKVKTQSDLIQDLERI